MERMSLRAVQLSQKELIAVLASLDVVLERIGEDLKSGDPIKYDLMTSARQKLHKLYMQPAQAMITA